MVSHLKTYLLNKWDVWKYIDAVVNAGNKLVLHVRSVCGAVKSVCAGDGSILPPFTSIAPRPGGPTVPSWGWRWVFRSNFFVSVLIKRLVLSNINLSPFACFTSIGKICIVYSNIHWGCSSRASFMMQWYLPLLLFLLLLIPIITGRPFLSIIEERWRRFVGTLLLPWSAFALLLLCSGAGSQSKPSFPLRKRLGAFHS